MFGDAREDRMVAESEAWEFGPGSVGPFRPEEPWMAEFKRQFPGDRDPMEPVQQARLTAEERRRWEARVREGSARKEKFGGCWWFHPTRP